jgi:peptide/nickel transport system permease protein
MRAKTADPGPWRRSLRQFRRDKVAMVALLWVLLVGLVAVLSILWTPYPPNRGSVGPILSDPSGAHWLGTDDLGRDVLSRLMVGARVALRMSVSVVTAAVVLAIPLGLVAGYKGGWLDTIVMRILDAVTSVPGIIAALAIVGVLGRGLVNVGIALTVILCPNFVRLIRAQALAVSAEPYIAASRSVGSRTHWIMLARVLPGVVPALAVQVSLGLGLVLTAEAILSFLGVGVQIPNASWGVELQRANTSLTRHPSGLFPPALAIGSVVLAFNLIGDGFRDALGVGTSRRARKRARQGITSVARTPAAVAAPPSDARLVVQDLEVEFHTPDATLRAIDGVSLEVAAGEVLGLVGESGSGKTVTAMSIMRLLPSPPGLITGGTVRYQGTDLLDLDLEGMRAIRGAEIAMVFQNPMTSLDPVFTIGNSLREAIRNHEPLSRRAANQRAIELLDLVGIPNAAHRLDDLPHQFSGGMRQRVMIAMALAGRPKLLIADEPTTALDVTIQAQILDLLASLGDELGMAMILVTHDLGVVAEICDRVAVMYAGQIVETAPVEELFASPVHPYTAGLLGAMPSTARTERRLTALPGTVPSLSAMPPGCRFASRCPHAIDACRAAPPAPEVIRGHLVRCVRAAELELTPR